MRGKSNILTEQEHQKSFVSFIKAPESSTHLNEHLSNILTQQVFLKGVQNSYIGQISGNKQEIKELSFDDLLPSILQDLQNPQNLKQSHIHKSSSLKKVTTSRTLIYDKSMSRIEEMSEKSLQLQDKQVFTLKSFVNKDKVQLFEPANCGFCNQNIKSNQVRLLLLNQSTLQIHRLISQGISNENNNQPVFILNFDTVTAQVKISPYPTNKQLIITVGEFTLLLQHVSREAVVQWSEKIEQIRLKSIGYQFNLSKLAQIHEFYLRRHQSEDFFVNNCQTGDIVLFQDDHFYAKVQRFVTRSPFDHVAMVIKDVNYGLLLFESNAGSGVSLTPWRSLIRFKWYQNIPRITWRRLQIQRDVAFNSCIQNFIKENLQADYHISFQKLLSAHSYIRPPSYSSNDNKKEEKIKEHGFFCSELVATLYKQLGLLTRDTANPNYQPATKFYPKDFSQKGNRKLDKGSLSTEYDIFFDENVLKQKYKQFLNNQK